MLGAMAAYEKALSLLDSEQQHRESRLTYFRERMGRILCEDQLSGKFRKVTLEIFDADVDFIYVSVEVESMKVCRISVDHKCERNPIACRDD